MTGQTRRTFVKNSLTSIAAILLNKTVPTIAYPKESSQGVPFRLEGIITDTLSGQGIGGLEVKFTPPNDTFEYQAFTDTSGSYIFDIITSVEQIDYADANTRARIALGVQGLRSRGNGVDFDVLNGTDNVLKLKIFNILGREVYSGTSGGFGDATIGWDGRNNVGNQVADGMYVYRVSNDAGYSVTGKVTMAGHKYANLGTRGKIQYKKTIPGINPKANSLYKRTATEGRLKILSNTHYNYDNATLDATNWNENLDVQMIQRFEDDQNAGLDGLDHLKFYTVTDGTSSNTRIGRYLIEKGSILVNMNRADTAVSGEFKDLVWDGLKEWETKINEHLPDGKKITFFEEVNYDPTPDNITSNGRSDNSAGGWNVTYNHNSAGQFPNSSIIWMPSDIDPQYPVYGNLKLEPVDLSGVTSEQKLTIKGLASHEAGHGLNFNAHSSFSNHIMNDVAYILGHQVSTFEGKMKAIQYKLKNLTDMKFYSK